MHDVVVLFLDRPELDFWVVGFVHKSLSLFAEEAPALASPMISNPQQFSFGMDHRCACGLLALER